MLGGFNSRLNGMGSIRSVVTGTALAPMQYRIAVPFLVKWTKSYLGVKFVLMVLSSIVFWMLFNVLYGGLAGWVALFVLQIFYVLQSQFDYVEQYLELLCWSLVFIAGIYGNIYLAVVITVIATLNRETSIYIPLVYYGLTGNMAYSLLVMVAMLLPVVFLRLVYGIRPNYLDVYGFKLIKNKWHLRLNVMNLFQKKELHSILPSILIISMATMSVWYGLLPLRVNIVAVLFSVIWLLRSRINEPRVGMPLMFFAVQPIIRWLS
jgi:hypothetical protein